MSIDTLPATRHDIPDATPPERLVYVLQNVVGDSQGATVCYTLTTDDGAELASLPVELREGFYNVTRAFRGANPLTMSALNAAGNGRLLTLKISNLSPHCGADEDTISVNALTGCDSHGRIVLTADITCADQTPED